MTDLSISTNAYRTLAREDVSTALLGWRVWLFLGWQDIKLRYRRSRLGPFWITISMAITVYSMGFLYGHLFKMPLRQYFPLLATGILTWSLISTVLNESTNTFVESAAYLRQMKLPYATFVLRILTRNLIIFAHNAIAILPVLLFYHVAINFNTLFVVIGIAFIAVNGFFYGLVLSIIGARFRDIAPIVGSLIQVVFFLTPIMWSPALLPNNYQFIVDLNPFAQFINLVREPLLGQTPNDYSLLVVGVITLLGIALAFYLLTRARHRIVYWL